MILDFLPDEIYSSIKLLKENLIFNVRLRIGQPIIINYDFRKIYLTKYGESKDSANAIKCKKEHIENIIEKVTYSSLYAYNEKIKQGFISTKDGVRIGLSGECVFDNGKIITIKNVESLNIRVPHFIDGCANKIFACLTKNFNQNLLLVSPPFCGKTTILKDLVKKINARYDKNILVIDERGEFSSICGENIDSVRYSDKLFAFNYALRVMSPNIVITDELCSESDWRCAKNAVNSGVNIIASCHSNSFEELIGKSFFINGIFDKYVFLRSNGKPGEVDSIFDKNGEKI